MKPDLLGHDLHIFGSGCKALIAAVFWQAFKDCYRSNRDVSVPAAEWLLSTGRTWWIDYLELDGDLYDDALDKVMHPSWRHNPSNIPVLAGVREVSRPLRTAVQDAVTMPERADDMPPYIERPLREWLEV